MTDTNIGFVVSKSEENGKFDRFKTFEDAINSIKAIDAATHHGTISVVRIDESDSTPHLKGKPAHRFFLDVNLTDFDGDGSERDPWPDFRTAGEEILKLERSQKIKLETNDRLVLESRKIFSATPFEKKKQRIERVAQFALGMISISLVLPVVAILFYLVYQAWPSLHWEFLTANPSDMGTTGGIWAPLVGTFFLVLTSLVISAPIGVLAGVYLNEYAGDNWFTRIINLAVVNLAGVPSIVHALFGLGAFVYAARFGQSMIAASATLSVMTLPVIITSTREALSSVPMSFRQACWNLGASRWQTIRTIVLPNSISGILTGVILQVARAAGETAPIMFTGAAIFLPVDNEGIGYWIPYGLWDKVMALSMHLFTLREQIPDAPLSMQYGTAVVLIGLVLCVNSISIAVRVYLRSRKKW